MRQEMNIASPSTGWFARLRDGLRRTKEGILRPFEELLRRGKVDEEFFAELEAVLLQADVGPATTEKLLGRLKERVARERLVEAEVLKEALATEVLALFSSCRADLDLSARGVVYLVVGVNGVGKTTTAAKMAAHMRKEGIGVLLVAADTFRAAAIEQLETWGARLGVEVIRHGPGADPAAVAFDGLAAARARGYENVIVDTAGRLHTKANLLEELRKVRRVVEAGLDGRRLCSLLVLDATTGQNALHQAQVFREVVGTGAAVLTKLDGTAKGGVAIALVDRIGLPIALVGVGEGIEDLREFVPEEFVAALFGA
ncbi:MAG: signal recognition particle-docking protein FtsY [Firmicutes bacterium]|nr:signal recognition particle-docking protein FtsY [Bacillota bacterium]